MFQTIALLKKLCYLVAAVCFVALCVTGFWPWLVRGVHISGYWMLVHASLAPVFALCLAVLAVVWADRFRFEKADWPGLQRWFRRSSRSPVPEPGPSAHWTVILWKVTFWLIVALSLPLILSIVLSMLLLFGTHGQNVLLAVHRWTAIFFAIAVIIHTYMAVRVRMAR